MIKKPFQRKAVLRLPGQIWTTAVEIEFVKHIGEWCDPEKHPRIVPQSELWVRYLRAMPLRTDWGDIDPLRVRQVVLALLYTTGEQSSPT